MGGFFLLQSAVWLYEFLHRASKSFQSFNGLHRTNLVFANGYASDLAFVRFDGRLSSVIKSVGKTRAAVQSGEGENVVSTNGNLFSYKPVGIKA